MTPVKPLIRVGFGDYKVSTQKSFITSTPPVTIKLFLMERDGGGSIKTLNFFEPKTFLESNKPQARDALKIICHKLFCRHPYCG